MHSACSQELKSAGWGWIGIWINGCTIRILIEIFMIEESRAGERKSKVALELTKELHYVLELIFRI